MIVSGLRFWGQEVENCSSWNKATVVGEMSGTINYVLIFLRIDRRRENRRKHHCLNPAILALWFVWSHISWLYILFSFYSWKELFYICSKFEFRITLLKSTIWWLVEIYWKVWKIQLFVTRKTPEVFYSCVRKQTWQLYTKETQKLLLQEEYWYFPTTIKAEIDI